MTYQRRALAGTGFVEMYDDDKSVAGPFTPAEADAWVQARGARAAQSAVEESPAETFEPRGIL